MQRFFVLIVALLLFFPQLAMAQMSTATRASLAANELAFITPIYTNLIGNVSNFAAVYNTELDSIIWNHRLYYRTLCSMAIIEAVVKGKQLKATDNALAYLIAKYNAYDFAAVFQPIAPTPTPTPHPQDFHEYAGSAVAGQYCLHAANLTRDVLPEWNYNSLLIEIKNIALRLNAMGNWATYAESKWVDKTDSSAEEVTEVAGFFLSASELLPSSGPGAITPTERQSLYGQARNLVAYLIKQCDRGCAFPLNKWLVINHWMDPNPNYTLSYLTSFSEMGMIYTQQGKPLPSDIFTTSVINAITQVGNALQPYINTKFQFQGPYNIIDNASNILSSYNFSNTRYSLINSDNYPLHSSVPTDRVDSWNQYVLYGTSVVKVYLYRDGKTWHYSCNTAVTPGDCKAEHQTTPLSNLWGVINTANWGVNSTPGEKIDAQTQWYQPDAAGTKQNILFTKIFAGDQIYEYKCVPNGGCSATSKQSLSSFFPQGAWGIAPPTSSVDSVSQWINPGTQELRTYVTKGNIMWDFICRNMSAYPTGHTCTIGSSTDIASRWNPAVSPATWQAAGWINENLPPSSDLDAFVQYFRTDSPPNVNVQDSYIVKGNRAWQYRCTSGVGCSAITTVLLADQFRGIRDQFKWPFEANQADLQFIGVSDWGHDAAIQNSAYASLAYMNPAYIPWYQALQSEQDTRGRKQHGPFPELFVNGHWQYGPVNRTYNSSEAVVITHLMDGLQDMNWSTKQVDRTARLPTNIDRQNTHWWMNMLAGLNHSMAYLLLTDTKLIAPFVYPRVAPSSTPTITPIPIACLAPPVLSPVQQGSCSANAIPVTFSWSSVSGATGYLFRLSKPGGGIACDAGSYCPGPIGTTSTTVSVTPGQTYDWWVHSANNCSAGAGAYASGRFTANPCPTNTPLPLPGDFVKNNSVDYADFDYVRLSVQAGLQSILDFSTVVANYGRTQ